MSRPTYSRRIGSLSPVLNAYMDVPDYEHGDELGWAVKSNIAVKGLPHTAGIGAYDGRIAKKDAEVVARIRKAKGRILGTVNMDEGALGATTNNEHYGPSVNPWQLKHPLTDYYVPGGSSGGSGAAVAAGLCDVALGTDTMGSVRIPAAYCGVQGHKPTTGLVPTEGVIALSHTLDHVGPLARDVETLWQAMHIMADWGTPPVLAPLETGTLRIGLWMGEGHITLQDAVARGMDLTTSTLQDAGAVFRPVAPPLYDYSKSRRAGLLISEVEGAKVHGIGPDDYRREGFSEPFWNMLQWGVRQPKEKVEAAYGHIAAIGAAARSVWDEVDLIIAPTAPQTAFHYKEPVPANQADFTAWANFARLPACAIFTGMSDEGLPLSLQVIGPEGEDRTVLRAAAALEAVFGKPPSPPDFDW